MMGRGSTKKVISGVANSLKAGRKSITDISKETGLDRSSVSKYLKILEDAGLLVEEKKGKSKLYTFSHNIRKDTYFGLPLSDKSEKQAYSLFHLIKKFWKEATSKELLRTFAQKIAYKVIKRFDLDIPTGWYLYGGISIVVYDTLKNYDLDYKFPADVIDFIKETTLTYSKLDHAFDSKNKQYEENRLYKLKEEILRIFSSSKFYDHPKNFIYVINKKLRKLFRLAKVPERETYSDLIDAYIDLMEDIYNKLDEKKIININAKLISLFDSIWKYVAMFNLKEDLSDYYSDKILESRFSSDIIQQEDEIVELGTKLQSMIPVDSMRKKLREALNKITLLNEEEQKEKAKKLERLREEMGLKKFNKYLRKKMGLD